MSKEHFMGSSRSVCLITFFNLGTVQHPGIPQGVKQGQEFTLWVPFPLGASIPRFVLVMLFPQVFSIWLASLCGFAHTFAPCTLLSLGWKPLGFYHIRIDHPGFRKTGTSPTELGHPQCLVRSGYCSPSEHTQVVSQFQLLAALLTPLVLTFSLSPACLLPRA
jgi:hypothetical protein